MGKYYRIATKMNTKYRSLYQLFYRLHTSNNLLKHWMLRLVFSKKQPKICCSIKEKSYVYVYETRK